MKKIYVTTALPYVNAAPHIGHALEFIQADVIARSKRACGYEVYFLSGSDENAIKNIQAAESEGISVEKLVLRNANKFIELLQLLNISNDQFIRTTEPRHKHAAQELWKKTNPDDIYTKKYRGLYCVGCEAFYEEKELENGECPEHPGKKIEVVEEENYFFKLSAYTSRLEEIIKSDKLQIVPVTRKNEILSLIRQGLEDFSISRSIIRSKGWGVPVPNDKTQTMYVWYDALTNYISALGYPNDLELYKNFWAGDGEKIHVIGKGITRFHALYWPAMLLSAGVPIPTQEFVHGYVTAEGKKMSKTIGNVVDPFRLIEKFGCDAVRYYFLREISPFEDGDYSEEKFRARYNGDLANGLGNLLARTLTLTKKYEGELTGEMMEEFKNSLKETKKAVNVYLEQFKFNEALAEIWKLITRVDVYINEKKPWAMKDAKERGEVVSNLYYMWDEFSDLIEVFMPHTAEEIKKRFEEKNPGTSLFPRLV